MCANPNCSCRSCASNQMNFSQEVGILDKIQPESFEFQGENETGFPAELYEWEFEGEGQPYSVSSNPFTSRMGNEFQPELFEFSAELAAKISLPPMDARPFGGNAQLQTDANNLAQQYATRKREPIAKFITWLTDDYRQTIEGARQRFGEKWLKQIRKLSDPAAQRSSYSTQIVNISQAWLVSRHEQLGFNTTSYPAHVAFNRPALPPAPRVATPLVEGSDKAPVTATVIRFVEELKKRHNGFSASTYRGHGGGAFNEKGYSIDIYLKKPKDNRGFYQPRDAVAFLQAVHAAAKAASVEWRMIYNDFSVADAVNRALNKRHVIFVGGVRTNRGQVTGLNWHGPDPLILHFHLDLIPTKAGSSSSIVDTIATAGTAGVNSTGNGVRPGSEAQILQPALQRGLRAPEQLTDLLFFARHPERQGRKLSPGEPQFEQLRREWLDIRNRIVPAFLRANSVPSPQAQPSQTNTRPGAHAHTPACNRFALNQSGLVRWREITALLNQYRGTIPLDFLLGWIMVESGGNNKTVTKSLDERGFFQLHPANSRSLGLSTLDHRRLSDDPAHSIRSGIRLVQSYGKKALQLGVPQSSPVFWHVTKLLHWLPAGINKIIAHMKRNQVDFNKMTWTDFKRYIDQYPDLQRITARTSSGRTGSWATRQGTQNTDKVLAAAGCLQQQLLVAPAN
jgi:hypothetical protein